MQLKLAIAGLSGSGKSTVVDIIKKHVKCRVQTTAFAALFKEFTGQVFDFTPAQLYGPSSARNAIDTRYSSDKTGLMHWVQSLWNNKKYHQSRIDAAFRFQANVNGWLTKVVPSDADAELAERLLYSWFLDVLYRDTISPRYVLQTIGSEWGRHVHPRIWSRATINNIDANADLVLVSDLRFLNEAEDWISNGGIVWRIVRPNTVDNTIHVAGVANHLSEREQTSDAMDKYIAVTVVNTGSLKDLEDQVLAILHTHHGYLFTT